MHQYHNLVQTILDEGEQKTDRTGTGTLSVFGHQMRFNLNYGFPLLTSKFTPFKHTVGELLWFLSGDVSVTRLRDNYGVTFWDEWQHDDGTIGDGYGKQFRHIDMFYPVTPKKYEPAPVNTWLDTLPSKSGKRDLNKRTVHGVGYYGAYDKDDEHYTLLVDVWRDMIGRCYDATDGAFSGYGAIGIHVSEEWQCFANFQRDAKKIPNWALKLEYPNDYSLDKDTLWASNRYSKDTVMWASRKVQNANRSNTAYFTATDPDGKERAFTSIGEALREHGLNVSAVHRCLNGLLKRHHGWTNFQYIEVPEGQVLRYYEVDQLKRLLAGLKHEPDSRRHVMTLWNPVDVDRTVLPPCHGTTIQFYVSANKRLSCQMYQRSVDTFLGLPVNIASYAALTMMIAKLLDYGVGELIWTGGDCHLYLNHLEQAQELQRRFHAGEVPGLPTLRISGEQRSIDDFKISDFELINYTPLGKLPGKVAV